MDAILHGGLSGGALAVLALCLLIALAFEFVNGFHDTANAVATVIYTNALPPGRAVLLSGVCNFVGVFGGLGVASSIIKLLPAELLVGGGTGLGLAMVLSLLLAAIAWNLGTWSLGLPASSSHTMIGSILGVGLANSLRPDHVFGAGVNVSKVKEVGLALLVSPVFGFLLAAALLLTLRRAVSDERLFAPPHDEDPPPGWIRALLVATCASVSWAHGKNDGQKGIGLFMLILIGIVPASFALDLDAPRERIAETVAALREVEDQLAPPSVAAGVTPAGLLVAPVALVADGQQAGGRRAEEQGGVGPAPTEAEQARALARRVRGLLEGKASVRDVAPDDRWAARCGLLDLGQRLKAAGLAGELAPARREAAARAYARTAGLTEYAPWWVVVAVALALGVGTTVGWRRIVVTVGEKIGQAHLTYGQGAAAEVVAASTIGFAAYAGLPVSTTHVLSSGVAGTMVASGSPLQARTVRNILLAWLLTLPVTMLLAGGSFLVLARLLTRS